MTPKKMGRPTDAPKQTQLGIRFDEKTLSILDRFCEKEKISRNEFESLFERGNSIMDESPLLSGNA